MATYALYVHHLESGMNKKRDVMLSFPYLCKHGYHEDHSISIGTFLFCFCRRITRKMTKGIGDLGKGKTKEMTKEEEGEGQ